MQQAMQRSAPGVPAPKELLESPGVTAHDGPVRGVCTGAPPKQPGLRPPCSAAGQHCRLRGLPTCSHRACLQGMRLMAPSPALAPPLSPGLRHPLANPLADSCNRLVATAGADGYVRVWDFKGRGLRAEIRVGAPVARVAHHAGTCLMAAACEDHVIRMYDLEVRPAALGWGGTCCFVLGLLGWDGPGCAAVTMRGCPALPSECDACVCGWLPCLPVACCLRAALPALPALPPVPPLACLAAPGR